jgi:hypothetical protein
MRIDGLERLTPLIVDSRPVPKLSLEGTPLDIGTPSDSFPFGVRTRSFAVLDKSFLDGVNSAQLHYYAQMGWVFGVPEVLMYEHFRKRDKRRIANLFKLHRIEGRIVLLPGIGEMFRSEAKTLKPARVTMRAKRIGFTIQKGPAEEYFELDAPSLMSTEQRSRDLKVKLRATIDVWQLSLRHMPELKNTGPKEMPQVIKDLSLNIRNNRADMCGFYAHHRHRAFPPPESIDEGWAFFRWIQVQLLAGLDFIERYGVDVQPNEEMMLHEILDLDYLISALLVRGLACRETRFLERFRFLCPDGVILR